MFKKWLGTVILKLKINTNISHNLRNIPKYAKWVKYFHIINNQLLLILYNYDTSKLW